MSGYYSVENNIIYYREVKNINKFYNSLKRKI